MKFTTIIIVIVSSFSIALSLKSYASDYPKPKLEKEMDEMGSLLGGEGVIFKPTKEKSKATKVKIGNVNKYLFQAAIEVLKFAPLTSADSISGTIITEWYIPKGQKNTQFKIVVYVKDGSIGPEGLEVVAFERKKLRGVWLESHQSSSISSVLEDKIIRKARDFYLQSKEVKI